MLVLDQCCIVLYASCQCNFDYFSNRKRTGTDARNRTGHSMTYGHASFLILFPEATMLPENYRVAVSCPQRKIRKQLKHCSCSTICSKNIFLAGLKLSISASRCFAVTVLNKALYVPFQIMLSAVLISSI